MTDPKWRQFEHFVADLQRELAPQGAAVVVDERIMGKLSGVARQLDVVVRVKLETITLMTVIECKDHAKPLDVKQVEAFMGVVEDISANRGVLVGARGFTAAAYRRARAAGIDALTPVDVESLEWPVLVALPTLVIQAYPSFQFGIRSCAERLPFTAKDVPHLPLFNREGHRVGTPLIRAMHLWESVAKPDSEEVQVFDLASPGVYVHDERGALAAIQLQVQVRADRRLYFGSVPLTRARGFAGQTAEGVAYLRTREATTAWIEFAEVERSWQKVNTAEDLSVKPVLIANVMSVAPPEGLGV